jgi:hypothetical protein
VTSDGPEFYAEGRDCERTWCKYRFAAHQHNVLASTGEGVRGVAGDVIEMGLRLSAAEDQLQVACGLAFDAGRAAAKATWKDREMETVNCQLRNGLRQARTELAMTRGPNSPTVQLRHLGQKLFAERRAYGAGVVAALTEMRAVVRRNEELTISLNLMAKRAAIADELLGHDASGSALAATLIYAAELLSGVVPGEELFAELLRRKADHVRTLAAFPCGPAPKDESAVPDVPARPDGHTPHGGEVFRLTVSGG